MRRRKFAGESRPPSTSSARLGASSDRLVPIALQYPGRAAFNFSYVARAGIHGESAARSWAG